MLSRFERWGVVCLGTMLPFMVTCSESPLSVMTSGPPKGTVDLTKTPFGAIFTLPNWPNPSADDYDEAFARLKTLGTLVSYVWEWLDGDVGLVHATRVAEEAERHDFDLLLQLGPQRLGDITPPSGLGSDSFNDPVLVERYVRDAEKLAQLRPKWLVLATEINLLASAHPDQFDSYIAAYQRAYQRVKEVSPETMVGVSYNLLAMLVDQQFGIIDRIGPQDFIGLTTYPDRLVAQGTFEDVDAFPIDYYSGIRDLFPDRPIAVTEIGWTTFDDPEMADQRTFVTRLPELFRDIAPIFVCWAMLYDGPAFDIRLLTQAQAESISQRFGVDPELLFERLNQMALLTRTGEAKPGFFSALAVFGGVDPEEDQ